MIEQVWLQWALTACFCATGIWSGLQLVVDSGALGKVRHAFHVLMSAGMAAMIWPWGMSLASGPQGALFILAAGWFVGVTAYELRARHHHGHPFWHQPYHAVMMAAMAWMVLAMIPMGAGGGGHEHHALPMWSALLGVAFVVAMLAGTAMFTVDVLSGPSGANRNIARDGGHGLHIGRWSTENASQAAMSLGMAVMIVPMVAV